MIKGEYLLEHLSHAILDTRWRNGKGLRSVESVQNGPTQRKTCNAISNQHHNNGNYDIHLIRQLRGVVE